MTRGSDEADSAKRNRLLPLIGIEHAIVALILLVVGIALVANAHTDLSGDITKLAGRLGVDPSSNGIERLIGSAKKLTADKLRFYGIVAIGHGLLEGAEGYGLVRRHRWGEYLTVVATLLLFIPDIYELVKEPSVLKLALFALNLAMISYLAVHLRRTRGDDGAPEATRSRAGHNPTHPLHEVDRLSRGDAPRNIPPPVSGRARWGNKMSERFP